MSSEYTLELDVPYTELEELGWDKLRLLRDISYKQMVQDAGGIFYERATGSLMLKARSRQSQWESQIALSQITTAADMWEEVNCARGGKMIYSKVGASQFANILSLAAENAIFHRFWSTDSMVPIMATKESFGVNQGFWTEIAINGPIETESIPFAGIQFGDFFLALNGDGTQDLFWSRDGSLDSDSWDCRMVIGSAPTNDKGGTQFVMGCGSAPSTYAYIMVMPFGRGNILVRSQINGLTLSGCYSHPEATLNAEQTGYDITKSGHFRLFASSIVPRNFGVRFGKLLFNTTGTVNDIAFGLPYAPTVTPDYESYYTVTRGTAAASYELLDESDAAFVADGTKKKIKTRFTLTGDGYSTPCFDSYKLSFAPKIKTYTPRTITIPAECIDTLDFADGENWDEQQIDVTLVDDGTNTDLASLKWRSEINGRLLIDGEPRAAFLFKKPATVLKKRKNYITLTGKNLGVSKVQEKRFMYPKTYGGFTPPDAVRDILKHAGFQDSDIVTDYDALTLPTSSLQGQGTDKGKSEIKSQPQFNSPVEEFLNWVRDNFDNWPLRYKGDMKWYYQRPVTPTVETATFIPDGPRCNDWAPWYDNLSFEVEPPECNLLYLFGQTDQGEVIANYAVDGNSISYDGDPKPLNYIGRMKHIILIDSALNTIDILTEALTNSFDKLSKAIVWPKWTGPFVPTLDIDDGVRLRDFGLVQVKSMTANAKSPKELEHTACCSYTGLLISGDKSYMPVVPVYENTHGRILTDQGIYHKALTKYVNKKSGAGDVHVKSNTTSQRLEQEAMLTEILRGNVTWGTPVVVS